MRNRILGAVCAIMLGLSVSIANASTFTYQISGEGLEGTHIVVLFINDLPVVIDTVEADGSPITISLDGIRPGRYAIYVRVYDAAATPLFETRASIVTIE